MVSKVIACLELDLLNLGSSKSATNCARTYNQTFSDEPPADLYSSDTEDHSEFGFSPVLTHRHVWDAVILLCLLEDCTKRDTILDLSHTDNQDERLRKAMQARNIRIQRYGLGEVLHRCRKCTRFYDNRDAGEGICRFISRLSEHLNGSAETYDSASTRACRRH